MRLRHHPHGGGGVRRTAHIAQNSNLHFNLPRAHSAGNLIELQVPQHTYDTVISHTNGLHGHVGRGIEDI